MAYKKIGWKDYPNKTTPVNAKNLDHMEEGILENSNAIDELNTNLSNNFGTSIDIEIDTEYTCPDDGIVLFGGYGTSVTGLNINGHIIAYVYGGDQAYVSIAQSWRVKKGDIVVIQRLVDTTGLEINIHNFVPYA